jgi:23S rRNA (cytidine2498-2'-O)-methyltransferase
MGLDMSAESAQFVFMTCRAGAESALKHEVARVQPDWRPSFSRPGFLTFKNPGNQPVEPQRLAEQNWTFAHTQGISFGRLAGDQLAELTREFWQHAEVAALVSSKVAFDIHVWQREPVSDDACGLAEFVTPLCIEIEKELRSRAPQDAKLLREIAAHRKASPRHTHVLDIVVVEPGEWWIGYHIALRPVERWPGGAIPVRLPEHAVSRAYAKMEEALQWSNLPVAPEDECVEIGCAPGGASQALLERGLFVTGIDPADMDPAVLEHARFRHLKKRGSDVRRNEFEGVRWLAADMNIAPEDTLAEVEGVVKHPRISIRGMVLTLKFAEWDLADRIPDYISRVRSWGYRDVRTRQLVTGGQEICLVALKRKALRRLGKKKRTRRRAAGVEVAAAIEPPASRPDPSHSAPPAPHF